MKRILFICGSAEPGKDGVGDYSIKLADWLRLHNCQVDVLAANDKFIESSEEKAEILRLSSKLKMKQRRNAIQEKIDDFSPDIIFLQYVPYAFHKKGMPLKFARMLGSVKTTAEWIIMVHEPYIGGKLNTKGKFVQFAQQKALKRLVKLTSPKRVFTSIKKYENALAEIGIVSSILPLFGNIRFTEVDCERSDSLKRVVGVFFGAPPRKENFRFFKEGLIKVSSRVNMQLNLCGKNSGGEFYLYLKQAFENEPIDLQNLGELSENELSQLFLKCNFGISRIAPDLIGKSGSAISLLEHGAKLWIPLAKSQDEIDNEVLFRPDLCFANLSELLNDRSEPGKISNLDKVGKLLLNQINLA